jgi:acetolactate synthase-1/2/3 large subunit
LDEFASNAEVIHIDIDPAEISKNRAPQLGIIGDVRKILMELLIFLRNNSFIDINQTKSWLKRIYKWKEMYPLININYNSQKLSPQETILCTLLKILIILLESCSRFDGGYILLSLERSTR